METRFWSKVDKSSDCWVWTAATSADGYGLISRPGHSTGYLLSHRYSAMLHFGMFDSRLKVCHSCDNTRCVRPSHLFLGTHADNMRDMGRKGRSHFQKNPHAAAENGRRGRGSKHIREST